MTPAEAKALLAWSHLLKDYRERDFLRRYGTLTPAESKAELDAFEAEYPEIEAAWKRLREIAEGRG